MSVWKLLKTGSLTVLLILASCKGDDIIINTDNLDDNRILSSALPAINYTFSISDAIKEMDDHHLFVDENGLLNFRSTQEVSFEWAELAEINDVVGSRTYFMNQFLIVNSASTFETSGSISFQEKLKFNDANDVRYDRAILDNGDFELFLKVPSGFIGNVTISIPETDPMIITTFELDGVDNELSKIVSLKDRTIEFAQSIDSSYVTLKVDFDDLSFSGIAEGQIDIDFKLSNLKIEMLKGYFGQKNTNIKSVILDIDGMGEVKDLTSFEFKEIALSLKVDNHIGIPFNIQVADILFIKTDDDIEYDKLLVNGSPKVNMYIDPATFGPPITHAYNDTIINSENSNLISASNPFPKKITFDAFSISNPKGEIAGKPNFIGGLDSLYAELQIESPLWLSVRKYTRTDSIDFNFKKIMDQDRDNADLIKTLAVHLDFYNKLPFEVNANLFIADAHGNKIEDVLSNFKSLLTTGEINAEGRVSEANHTNVIIEFTNDQVLKFFDQNAMLLILETQASSHKNETEFIKVFEDADLKISISLETSARIPSFN